MRRSLAAFFCVVSSVAATGISTSPASAATSCTSHVCTWTGKNYTGQQATSGGNNGVCYFNLTVKSYKVTDNKWMRIYDGTNCNGAYYLTKGSSGDATTHGWVAQSYKRVASDNN